MNKKILLVVVLVLVFIALVVSVLNKKNKMPNEEDNYIKNTIIGTDNVESEVKEITMTSFVEMVDGKPKPQYSIKDITVKKGDKVRIKITVTSGMHDFKIDEFGVYADTQLNKESVVEFVADKTGEFIYYCTKPGHRENGHWGTLKVIE